MWNSLFSTRKMKRQTILEHQKRIELLTYRLQGDCTTCCATNANIRRSFRISNKIHFACSLADKTPNPVSQSDLAIRRKFAFPCSQASYSETSKAISLIYVVVVANNLPTYQVVWRPIEESNFYNLTKTLCLYKRSAVKLIGRIRRNPLKLLSSILSLADKLIVFGPYHNLRFNVSFVRWHNYYIIPTVKNNTFRQPFIAVFPTHTQPTKYPIIPFA